MAAQKAFTVLIVFVTTQHTYQKQCVKFRRKKFIPDNNGVMYLSDIKSLSDLKNQTIVSSCVTHIWPSCSYFKGQEQICFNPTSWHLVTYNFLRGHKF